MTRDARIDAYIAQAAPFARPILSHLRELVHATVPDVAETIKWSMPHFVLGPKNLAAIAAFKAHAAFVVHGEGRKGVEHVAGMGLCGKLTRMEDLPADATLRESLLAARTRLEIAAGSPGRNDKPSTPRAAIAMPDDLAAALVGPARANYDRLAPSYQREYCEWIVDAKRADTRSRRIEQAAQWLAEGKKRNWKYDRC